MSEAVVKYQTNPLSLLHDPKSLVDTANMLQNFVQQQNLFSIIAGRKYPNVEAWQFAGSVLGVFPEVVSVVNVSSGKEVQYRATVVLKHNGNIVGRGIASCSNKEKTKSSFDEYAIESMAQTRAVGKAYRLLLGFLMKAAGFEPTSEEEMLFAAAKGSKYDMSKHENRADEELLSQLESIIESRFVGEQDKLYYADAIRITREGATTEQMINEVPVKPLDRTSAVKIIKHFNDEINAAKALEEAAIITDWDSKIQECTTLYELNETLSSLSNIDSEELRKRLGIMLTDRAKTIGCKYSKDLKEYISVSP